MVLRNSGRVGSRRLYRSLPRDERGGDFCMPSMGTEVCLPAVLVGHSWGAWLALFYNPTTAIEFLDVSLRLFPFLFVFLPPL